MTTEAPRQPAFVRKHAKLLLASVAFTLGLVWIMHKGALPLLPPQGTLARVDTPTLALALLALLVSMLTKYGRIHFLIAPLASVPKRKIMTISAISMALITLLPFRLGEFARPALLRQKGKLSGWAITGTVGAERIIDGLAFGVTLLVGLALAHPHEPLPDHIGSLPVPAALVPRAAIAATSAFGVAMLVMGLFFVWRDFARRLTERVVGVVSKPLARRLADLVSNLSDGLKFLPNLRYTLPYLAATGVCVLAHVWCIRLLTDCVGLAPLSFAQSAVVTGVLALGFALPNAPGFFGAVQLALYASLALYLRPAQVIHEGAAVVFLFYVAYLGIIAGLALLALLVEYVSPAETIPNEQTA